MTMTKTIKPTSKGDTVHVGTDIDRETADKFRSLCELRGFKQNRLIDGWIRDWIELPELTQIDLYHRKSSAENVLRKEIENVLRQLRLLPPEHAGGEVVAQPRRR